MIRGESDPLIVLGDGRADHKGKGRTGIRSLHRKHCPARKGRKSNANLTASNSNEGSERKDLRFFNLYRLIDENFLLECWRDIRKNAAYGVDGISARQYEENLMDNIGNLVERLKRKTYRARLVRRHWIPKPDGRQRPLAIPVVEDKLLQLAVRRILEAIYEQDFLRCSYG